MANELYNSVIITGGAGSFGKACAAFLLHNKMADRVCIYSRNEHAQAEMRALLQDDPRLRFFIGDIRDVERLEEAFSGVELVIHAAALKRIEVGKYNPTEMVRTNVDGAINVVTAARRSAVRRVVGLSTDKAFEPISPYGVSKAMMEHILLAANHTQGRAGPHFVLTRYGNVWGSAGSILPTWARMIREGARELPVTDPECTRFFMTMKHAVELVIGAAAHEKPGDIAVPTLPAYRVGDLAEALGMPIRITGLPRYEKRHESMSNGNCSETAERMSVEDLAGHVSLWMGRR